MGVKLTRDAILEMSDRATREVDVPEWGGTVTIKEWGLPERGAFVEIMEKRSSGEMGMADAMALCVVLSVVDENGNRIFTDKDVAVVSCKSGKAAERIFSAAMALNMITRKDVEVLAGN